MNQSSTRTLRTIAIFAGSILMLAARFAGAAEYSTRLWQMENGLPNNIVQTVIQTKDGYLWVGTREGLARFDGVKFQPIDLLTEIRNPSILCLLESRAGTLWIGTEMSGLLTLQNGELKRWSSPNGAKDFAVAEIHEGGDGAIWIGSSEGVLKLEDGKLQKHGGFKNGVQSLCVDNHGGVWRAGPGLTRLDVASPTNYVLQTGTLPSEARKVYCDREGVFWIATRDILVRCKDGVAEIFRRGDGPSGFVSVVTRDREGHVWIGSYSGVSRFSDGKFLSENEPDAPSYRVYAIFQDREETLWVGSEEGLSRLTPKHFKTYTKKDGLTLNTIVTVCPSADGSVWVSAWGGGLNNIAGEKVSSFGKENGLSSDFVLAMHESRDGTLWAGTDYGSVLNRIRDGSVVTFGKEQGFVANATTAILEDAQGALWIGTRGGLHRFKDNQFTKFGVEDGLSHVKINALCEGALGNIWIGTDAGLTSEKDGHFVDLSSEHPELKVTIFSLFEDKLKQLWIGTRDQGLLRWKDGKLDVFSSKQGLFSESIYSILEDDRNNLWLNSSKGIFRLEKRQLDAVANGEKVSFTSITYGKIDGILSSGQYKEVTQPSACKTKDGRLWFRTTQGVAVVDPEKITTNELPPPVVIEEVVANRNSIKLSRQTETEVLPLTISPGRGELEIHYTALSFRAPEKNQFRYKLEGADLNWVNAGDRRIAFYNNLRPGKYQFHVEASNNDGFWNESGATINVTLQPHFWQTWWFYAGTALASFGFVGGTVRAATRRKMQRNLERVEQQNAIERERTRIARDIHDDLGARLTKISMLTELAEREMSPQSVLGDHLQMIYDTAQEMLAQLDETVWAVNPRNDQLDRLAEYILHYAEEFFRHANIRCRLKMEEIPPLPLAAEPRHHIFLAVKEALNNAAKHAEATEVQVQLAFKNNKFHASIRDNGIGFDAAECLARGRGLENMRSRAENLGGKIELNSQNGVGTQIEMEFEIASFHNFSDEGV